MAKPTKSGKKTAARTADDVRFDRHYSNRTTGKSRKARASTAQDYRAEQRAVLKAQLRAEKQVRTLAGQLRRAIERSEESLRELDQFLAERFGGESSSAPRAEAADGAR